MVAGCPFVTVAAESSPRPDEEVLAGAQERIERHRKADAEIVVRTAKGRPVRGASVQVEQIQHEFLFGSNFFLFERVADADLMRAYEQRFAALWNEATLPFYWTGFEPVEGKPEYGYCDRAAAWCKERFITPKGHTLAWDHEVSSPKWLPPDLTEVAELSAERVKAIVAHYRGKIDLWDVVNEPRHIGNPRFREEARTHMGQWAAWIGAHDYTAGHLLVARAANPQARLTINDYQMDAGFLALLESLKQKGRFLFDVVGLQSHMHGAPWPLAQVWDTCETFRVLGLPLHFTEITVLSGPRTGPGEQWGPTESALEEKQADYVAKLYTLLFSHPAVEAAIWWDLSDRGAWQRAAAGLLRQDMSPKPAYDRLHALIKGQWRTRATGETGKDGSFKLRLFRGLHKVTVRHSDGREASVVAGWQGPTARRCEITFPEARKGPEYSPVNF